MEKFIFGIFEKIEFLRLSAIFIVETLILGDKRGPLNLSPTHDGQYMGVNGLLICFSALWVKKCRKKPIFT